MSGGSWYYIYRQVDEVADRLSTHTHNPLRLALVPHIRRLAEALHDIEWVDSSDKGPGDEDVAIRAYLEGFGGEPETAVLRAKLQSLMDTLNRLFPES